MLRRIKAVDLPVVFCLALAPVQWITLYEIAGFTLEPFHLPILAMALLTFGNPAYYRELGLFSRDNAMWLLPFVAYILMLFASLAYSNHSGGASVLARQALFFSLCVAVALRIKTNAAVTTTLYLGSLLGLCVYYFALFISANAIGISVIDRHLDFFSSGSFRELAYGFFRPVFNAFQDGGHEFHASLRNNVASALLVLFILIRIGMSDVSGGVTYRRVGSIASVVLLLSMIIILSRSVVASWLLSIAVVIMATRIRQSTVLLAAFFGVAGCASLVVLAQSDSPLAAGLFERLVTDTKSYSDRLKDYDFAMQLIDQHPILGVGYYRLMNGEFQQPHNLFLAAWTQAGVLAFVFSILFVFAFCALWLKAAIAAISTDGTWKLPCDARWVMALPVMAMFRLWSSGDGGNLNFSAWLSVGVFLGIVAQNREASPPPRNTSTESEP